MTDPVTDPEQPLRPPRQIDIDAPDRNFMGCLDCPRCGSSYRWPTSSLHAEHPRCILCDRCGHVEPITSPDEGPR